MSEVAATGAAVLARVPHEPTLEADGRVLIPDDIRQRLGIEPGWIAIQRVVGAHIEILFVPPDASPPRTGVTVPPDQWHEVTERAVAEGIAADWAKREDITIEPDPRDPA